jgi:hypothetical protein
VMKHVQADEATHQVPIAQIAPLQLPPARMRIMPH